MIIIANILVYLNYDLKLFVYLYLELHNFIYPALVLFEQKNCIDWINLFCYIRSLTNI